MLSSEKNHPSDSIEKEMTTTISFEPLIKKIRYLITMAKVFTA